MAERLGPKDVAERLMVVLANAFTGPTVDAVVVVTIVGDLGMPVAEASSRRSGRRIVRLRYRWSDLAPTAARGVTAFMDEIARFTDEGAVIRARLREAEREQTT